MNNIFKCFIFFWAAALFSVNAGQAERACGTSNSGVSLVAVLTQIVRLLLSILFELTKVSAPGVCLTKPPTTQPPSTTPPTTNPPTTIAPSTNPPATTEKPDPSKCSHTQKIYDDAGKYLKTACICSDETNYDKGCKSIGMKLFVISSTRIMNQLYSFGNINFECGAALWINGKENGDNVWLADGKPVIQEISNSNINTNRKNDCLIMYSEGIDQGGFKVENGDCNSNMGQFCEFMETPPPTTSARPTSPALTPTTLPTTSARPTSPASTPTTPPTTSTRPTTPVLTPTPPTISPTPKPDPSKCYKIRKVNDDAGNYLKTLCVFNTPQTYADGCKSIGMKLFSIGSSGVVTQLQSFGNANYVDGETYWVDGKEIGDNNWLTGGKQVPKEVHDSNLNNNGRNDCLIMKSPGNAKGGFKVNNVNCDSSFKQFCEFTEPPPPTTPDSTKCSRTQKINDDSGKYLKTACIYSSPRTYSDSCGGIGMKLFSISSKGIMNQLYSFGNSNVEAGAYLWVDGKENGDNNWLTNGKSVIKEICDLNVNSNGKNDCLAMRNLGAEQGGFTVTNVDCETIKWQFCEFK